MSGSLGKTAGTNGFGEAFPVRVATVSVAGERRVGVIAPDADAVAARSGPMASGMPGNPAGST
jgi:hypothetical protein